MGHDYIQFQAPADYFILNEKLLYPREPTSTGAPRKGLNVGQIARQLGLPARITNKIKLEVTANAYATVGLPAKLLGPRYFDLINAENFDNCLQALIDTGLVLDINIDAVRKSAKVVRSEIACDVSPTVMPKKWDYSRFRFFLCNAFRWKRIEPDLNSFGSIGRKENFKIYGKTREMALARHRPFIQENNIKVPDGLVRLEYRLTSSEKVRAAFGSKNLDDVLRQETNSVLSRLLRGVFIDINPETLYRAKDTKPFNDRLAIARENNFDPISIENVARQWGKHKSLRLRDINQAVIATHTEMQRSGNILKELLDLQLYLSQN